MGQAFADSHSRTQAQLIASAKGVLSRELAARILTLTARQRITVVQHPDVIECRRSAGAEAMSNRRYP
jgi:hypothetical protein